MNDILAYDLIKKQLDPRQKVGQLFMPAAFINDSEEDIRRLEALIRQHSIGGICFFHSRASAATNFEGKRKVVYNEHSLQTLKILIARYQKAASIPLLISIDAEWGLAMRVENTPKFPYAITLGAIREGEDLIFEVGRSIASDCKQAGIHWNFAPVVDINLNPDNPVIGYRSFGEDREEVSARSVAFMKGLQSGGILSCAKHFPGHGDTSTDSHLGLPLIDKDIKTLESNELYPFSKMIGAGVDSVMVGHLAVPALSGGEKVAASVSPAIIQNILRKKLGFEGVVVSDALNMRSVSRLFPDKGRLEWEAFKAGNDVLCFSEHVEEGIQTILENAPAASIEEAFGRVWKLKLKAFNTASGGNIPPISVQELNLKLAQASLSLVKGNREIIRNFREQGFKVWEVSDAPNQIFLKTLKTEGVTENSICLSPSATTLTEDYGHPGRVLIAVYPPSIKPPDNFGFSQEVLQVLNRLLREQEVIIYNFGNPYVLNLLEYQKAKAVVQVYQDFMGFQENAARHFMGNIEAGGKLPVTLKTN